MPSTPRTMHTLSPLRRPHPHTIPTNSNRTTPKSNKKTPIRNRRFHKKKSLLATILSRNAIRTLLNHKVGIEQPLPKKGKLKEQVDAGLALTRSIEAINRARLQLEDPSGTELSVPVMGDDVSEPLEGEGPPPLNHTILVKSRQRHDTGITYEIRDDETFEFIYEDYSSRVDVSVHELLIKKHGLLVARTATATSARIKTGDILYVCGVDPSKNMDTRRKFFYMRNTCTPIHEVKVQCKLTSKLRRLCFKWGEVVGKEPNTIMLLHQDRKLNRVLTVGEAGIKNLDYVYACPEI